MDFGTDIDGGWNFVNGDLQLINGEDNLKQALINRLTCDLGSLIYYENYGGLLFMFLGWKSKQSNLDFIRLDIENILAQEDRVSSMDVNVDYVEHGVKIDLTINGVEDINLTLNNNGVESIGD